jgi:predicted transcriptional regulator
MMKKPRKPAKGLAEPEAAYRHPADGGYVPEDALDAYLWRNRDAINASIRKSNEEYARGHYYTAEEVMAEIKARAKKRQARKAKKT